MIESMIGRVYEAAVLPDQWPALLHDMALEVDARGVVVFAATSRDDFNIVTPGAEELVDAYVGQGWMQSNERGAPMIAAMPPHFITDADYRTEAEMAAMPVYRELLIPMGMATAAGTIFPGVADDLVALTVEGFADTAAARRGMPLLDTMRPHLARALNLTSRLRLDRAQAMLDGLAAIGAPAAVIADTGRLRAWNEGFAERLGAIMVERRARLSFTDAALDRQFAALLEGHAGASRSLIVRPMEGQPPCVIHVLPLQRRARDVMGGAGMLMLVADGRNAMLPTADLLRLLFDLTPAEARLARVLLGGVTLPEAAARLGISHATARVHLRAIFAKTDTARQADLVRLLSAYGAPVAAGAG